MFCRHILIDVCMDYATGHLTVSKSSSITVFISSNEGQVQKLFSKVYLDAWHNIWFKQLFPCKQIIFFLTCYSTSGALLRKIGVLKSPHMPPSLKYPEQPCPHPSFCSGRSLGTKCRTQRGGFSATLPQSPSFALIPQLMVTNLWVVPLKLPLKGSKGEMDASFIFNSDYFTDVFYNSPTEKKNNQLNKLTNPTAGQQGCGRPCLSPWERTSSSVTGRHLLAVSNKHCALGWLWR